MELRELIKEVQEYLEVVLGEENLSAGAEAGRLRLLARLATSHSPPPAYYITMNKTDSLSKSPDKVWNEGSYEVMEGPPPVYSNTMPDVLSSSKRISRGDLISTASSQGLGKSTDGLSRRSVVTVQSGVLWRKKRRKPTFLPWCRITEYWAALAQTTLHLYPAERRSKPALQIDLSGYQARPSMNQLKPNQFAFEIFSPGKKTYQFFARSEEEVTGWIKAVSDGCSEGRILPNPPDMTCGNEDSLSSSQSQGEGPYEHYDVPDSRLRPVQSHYHSISYSRSPTQEHVYKNVDDLSCSDNTYYNILTSGREIKSEQIYQTISENNSDERSPSPTMSHVTSPVRIESPPSSHIESPMTSREPSPVTNEKVVAEVRTDEIDSATLNKRSSQRMSGGRVQQIVKSLEGHDTKDFEPVEVGRIDLHRLSR